MTRTPFVCRTASALAVAALVALVLAAPAVADPGQTTRESVSGSGAEADGDSASGGRPSISGDGLVTAFSSKASNLVADDSNGQQDIFVRDRTTGTIARASLARDGSQADGSSSDPSISADRRSVAFASAATNLVADDTDGKPDIFVRDRQTGATVRVSVATDGAQSDGSVTTAPSISADGRFVAFESDATSLVPGIPTGATEVFVHDRDADGNGTFDEPGLGGTATSVVSLAGAAGSNPDRATNAAISASGRYVAFQSSASNLVAGDANNAPDVFVRDRQTGTITRVSVAGDGSEATLPGGPAGTLRSGDSLAISGDGTQVAFQSTADNLVSGDTNTQADVFVRDQTAGTTVRVSEFNGGFQASTASSAPSLSFDGRRVSFGVVGNVFVRDRDADANGVFDEPGIQATATTAESVASSGARGNKSASDPSSISADGSRLAFASSASNLVPGDANGFADVFVHRLLTPVNTQALGVSKAGDGQGTVTSSVAGIDCGPDCLEDFATGTTITLSPSPAAASLFTGFSGDCTGMGPCVVTLDQVRSVIATFDLIRHGLTISKAGDGLGTVTSSPAGIDCGADCAENVVEGTSVTLTARPLPGFPSYTFSGFSGGGCSGAATTCTVTLDQARAVTATFGRATHTLSVSRAGAGRGTVTSSPAGIDCGSDCTQDYLEGTEVTLTATPAAAFAGFSGACTGTVRCTVPMDRAQSVTATFEDLSGGGDAARGPHPGAGRATAKLQVVRAGVSRSARRLVVVAPISRLASGSVRVGFFAAGRRVRFRERIDARRGRVRFSRRIPRVQAVVGTGILTIRYPGDADTRPQRVRLRVASGRASLAVKRPRIRGGRLRAGGTVSRRAHGVVRVQVEYVVDARTRTLALTAAIHKGRWRLDAALSKAVRDGIARREGTVQAYVLFSGNLSPRIGGEMKAVEVLIDR